MPDLNRPPLPTDELGGRPFTAEERQALHKLAERYEKIERIVEKDDAVRWLAAFSRSLAAWVVGIVAGISAIIYLVTGKGGGQ